MKPDYKLKAMDKRNSRKACLGAAWKNKDGSITIVMDPCCQVEYGNEIVYNLFPNTLKEPNET